MAGASSLFGHFSSPFSMQTKQPRHGNRFASLSQRYSNSTGPCDSMSSRIRSAARYVFPFLGLPMTTRIFTDVSTPISSLLPIDTLRSNRLCPVPGRHEPSHRGRSGRKARTLRRARDRFPRHRRRRRCDSTHPALHFRPVSAHRRADRLRLIPIHANGDRRSEPTKRRLRVP